MPADSNVIQMLYVNHSDWLFRRLRGRLGCKADAADLTHDTFVRIVVSGRLPTEAQSRAFLMQVAKGLTVDLYRRRALEHAYLEAVEALPAVHAPSPEQRALALETLTNIDRALDGLPSRVREAFLLARFEGLTYSTIADRLGVSIASVRKYMLSAASACLLAFDSADAVIECSE